MIKAQAAAVEKGKASKPAPAKNVVPTAPPPSAVVSSNVASSAGEAPKEAEKVQ